MIKAIRYDKGEIDRTEITEEGFLVSNPIVTRTGVFMYKNADGTIRKELRHPDDVFLEQSLKSMKMIPITLLHPQEKIVDDKNYKQLAKGYTGEKVRPDGKYVRVPIKVTDRDTVTTIMEGMRELSLGYSVELIEEPGEYNGERYDFRQTNIRYNHLAIVPSARAGREARISLDANDAEMVELNSGDAKNPKDGKNFNTDSKINKPTGGSKMSKINLDGIEYEAAPEVANAFKKQSERIDALEGSVQSLTEENSSIKADRDTVQEKLDAELKRDHKAEVQKAVEARIKLVSDASPHLNEEDRKRVNDMSDDEIKKAVILSKFPNAKLDGKDEVYIEGRYDAALEIEVDHSDENMANQRKHVNDGSNKNESRIDADESRKKMESSVLNAWKTEKA